MEKNNLEIGSCILSTTNSFKQCYLRNCSVAYSDTRQSTHFSLFTPSKISCSIARKIVTSIALKQLVFLRYFQAILLSDININYLDFDKLFSE